MLSRIATLSIQLLQTMFNAELKIMGAVFLALIAVDTGTARSTDGRGEAVKPADAAGRVAAISADSKVLSLESGGGRGVEPTKTAAKLDDKTKVELTGVLKGSTRKLKAGNSISAWLQTVWLKW
jgi:hypothetical protein